MENLSNSFYEYLPWVLGGGAAIFVLLIILRIWIGMASRKVKKRGIPPGMSMMDADKMRQKGTITEEEYRKIRSALAHHELQAERDRERIEREREILARLETNPELARELIQPVPDGRRAVSERKATAQASGPVGAGSSAPPPAQSAPPRTTGPSSMTPPRPVQPRPKAPAPNLDGDAPFKPRDIDILFEKGAISFEEYQRLKKFVE